MKFKRKGIFHVYIVQCIDGTYYTGSTKNLEERIKLHNKGNGAKYLRAKLPVKLVYAKKHRYYKNVLNAERNIKKLTREKKEELIKIYEKDLHRFAPLLSCTVAARCESKKRGRKSKRGDIRV